MGWIKKNKNKIIIKLVETLQKFNLKLKIKPRPWNYSYSDKIPSEARQYIIILYNVNPKNIKDVNVVGSFNSTLPFSTSTSFKVFCLEMNPPVVVPSFSFGITKFGIAQEIRNFDELKCALIGFKIDIFIFEKKRKLYPLNALQV